MTSENGDVASFPDHTSHRNTYYHTFMLAQVINRRPDFSLSKFSGKNMGFERFIVETHFFRYTYMYLLFLTFNFGENHEKFVSLADNISKIFVNRDWGGGTP